MTGSGTARPVADRPVADRRVAIRVYGAVRSGILTVAAAIGVLCILAFAGSLVAGIRPIVVISGSMEPTLPVGSVVFTRSVPAAEVEVGDIVTVQRPRDLGLLTHRVVETTAVGDGVYELVLKGDANQTADPAPYTVESVGRQAWHLPGLGHAVLALRSSAGLAVGIAAIAGLFAVFLLDPAALRRPTARDVDPGDGESSGTGPNHGTRRRDRRR